jgi:Ca2+-binding RTX toxin-like protein
MTTDIYGNDYLRFSTDSLISWLVDASKALSHGVKPTPSGSLGAEVDVSSGSLGGSVKFDYAVHPFNFDTPDGIPKEPINDLTCFDRQDAIVGSITTDFAYTFADIKSLNTAAKVASFFFSGEDFIDGGQKNDFLSGYGGDDTLWGYVGNDTLNGARGHDDLMGGDGEGGRDGKDTFVFDAPLKGSNSDSIYDFGHGDTIELDHSVFRGLQLGSLSKDALKTISDVNAFHHTDTFKGEDKSDRILVDREEGYYYFDRDGSGHRYESVLIFDARTDLHAGDFHVI